MAALAVELDTAGHGSAKVNMQHRHGTGNLPLVSLWDALLQPALQVLRKPPLALVQVQLACFDVVVLVLPRVSWIGFRSDFSKRIGRVWFRLCLCTVRCRTTTVGPFQLMGACWSPS